MMLLIHGSSQNPSPGSTPVVPLIEIFLKMPSPGQRAPVGKNKQHPASDDDAAAAVLINPIPQCGVGGGQCSSTQRRRGQRLQI